MQLYNILSLSYYAFSLGYINLGKQKNIFNNVLKRIYKNKAKINELEQEIKNLYYIYVDNNINNDLYSVQINNSFNIIDKFKSLLKEDIINLERKIKSKKDVDYINNKINNLLEVAHIFSSDDDFNNINMLIDILKELKYKNKDITKLLLYINNNNINSYNNIYENNIILKGSKSKRFIPLEINIIDNINKYIKDENIVNKIEDNIEKNTNKFLFIKKRI